MTKPKNSNCDKTQNSNCDETEKLKLWWNSKTQIVIKFYTWNFDETKLKRWQNSKTKIVTKLKTQIVTKLKNSNCDRAQIVRSKTQNLKMWQNLRTQIIRAPADPEPSIKDSGFTRTGLGVPVLCLHTATWPGRGPCLAETIWAGSRERFLVLFRNGLTGTGSGACWAETV